MYLKVGGGAGGCCSVLLMSGVVFSSVSSPEDPNQTQHPVLLARPGQSEASVVSTVQHFNIKYKQTSWSLLPIRQRFSAVSQNRRQADQDVCGSQSGSGRWRRGRRNNREGTEFPGGSQVLLHFHFYCPAQHFLSDLCHTNTLIKIKEAENLPIVLNTLFFSFLTL